MKAIYIKPEAEVVYLQISEDITWGEKGIARASQTKNHTANSGFFGDGEEDKNNSFFDD